MLHGVGVSDGMASVCYSLMLCYSLMSAFISASVSPMCTGIMGIMALINISALIGTDMMSEYHD